MTSYLLIHSDSKIRTEEAEKMISQAGLSKNHPDLLWCEEEKLGIEQARKIKDFLNLKPYQGETQAVVILSAENLTLDAQNALLKILEEPPASAMIILGVSLEDQLLPTIVSRCQIINLRGPASKSQTKERKDEIEKLLKASLEERFKFVEKLENREEFLFALTFYFRQEMLKYSAGVKLLPPQGWKLELFQVFLKDLVEAEKWAHQNVNIRAILEYLMLRIPQKLDTSD